MNPDASLPPPVWLQSSYLYYTFPDSTGQTDVTSPGASLGFGLREATQRLTTTFTAGYEVRHTKRRFAGGGGLNVTEHGASLQGATFFQMTRATNLSAIVSYGAANRYTWARGSWKRQLTDLDRAMSIGVDVFEYPPD